MRIESLAVAVLLASASAAAQALADVTISSAATQGMTCSGGVCSPTSSSAVLNVGDLESLLASGNVEVTTTGSGVQAKNIDVTAALSWSSTSTLALEAHQSIAIGQPVTVSGLGGLSIAAGSGGTFSFGKKGHVTFQNLSSPLSINGTSYTLVDTVAALAAAVKSKPGGAYAFAASFDARHDGTYKNSPVPTTLTGTVQGLGNTISRLKIRNYRKAEYYIGLFSQIDTSGYVENLRLSKINLEMNGKNNKWQVAAGGLVGNNEGTLFGDEVSGTATGQTEAEIGGLAAGNNGTIISSSADVNISSCCGGLVAGNNGTITLSHATGAVPYGAGFVADNEGTISQSYATGAANGVGGVGFVGSNEDSKSTIGKIDNSYATGAAYDAGFVGNDGDENDTVVTSSYSTGAVAQGGGGVDCAAAFPNDFTYDYWDTTTSGTKNGFCYNENISGVTGLTTKKLRSHLPKGFDHSIWAIDPRINNGFPYLINNPPEK